MKNRYKFLSLAILLASLNVSANTIGFSYNIDNQNFRNYGYKTAETYDVAIRIADPQLVGCRVAGLKVNIPADESQINDLSGWISSELKVENIDGVKTNVPDICVAPGNFHDGELTVEFNEPYLIPEEGVFVGYTFGSNPDNPPVTPVAVITGSNPDGFYFHASKSYPNWGNMTNYTSYNSAMVVYLEGDFPTNAVSLSTPEKIYTDVGESVPVSFVLKNYGVEPVGSIDYSYDTGEEVISGNYIWPEPAGGCYGAEFPLEIVLQPFSSQGNRVVEFSIDRVNGMPNESDLNSCSFDVVVRGFQPVKRPLVEEYTGLWCSFCPRGFVALEEMYEQYGEDFIAISYHYNDRIQAANLGGEGFPSRVTSYPGADVDRTLVMDPGNLYTYYPKMLAKSTNAEVEVEAKWTDASESVIEVTSTVTFIEDIDEADYKMTHILVVDELSNPAWGQMNAFSGYSADNYPGKWWDIFINGGAYVWNLDYNFVAAYSEKVKGVAGSVPSKIEAYEPVTYTSTIPTSKVLDTSGNEFVRENGGFYKARVISALIDGKSGEVVNCNKSPYLGSYFDNKGSGLEEVSAASIRETIYYDLNGMKVSNPSHGLYIKEDIFTDGRKKTSKIILP